MHKNKSHLGDSRAIKEYNKEGDAQVLPSIDPRKNSSPFEEQLRNQFRKLASNDQLEQSNKNRDQPHPSSEICFLFPKGRLPLRPSLTPKKLQVREQPFITLQQSQKKQLMFPFAIERELALKVHNDRPSNRAYIYQPPRKSSQPRIRHRSIISDSKIIRHSDPMAIEGIVVPLDAQADPVDTLQKNEQKEENAGESRKMFRFSKEKRSYSKMLAFNKQFSQFEKRTRDFLIIKTYDEISKQAAIVAEPQEKINAQQTNLQQQPLNPQQESTPKLNSRLFPSRQQVKATRRTVRAVRPPFQTYYYRDLLWKVNFSNSIYVEVPLQYQHRLKVHVGRGNNSCMVAGLISRRPWYSLTDKPQQANFVWTQLKVLPFYKKQSPFQRETPQRQDTYRPQSVLTTSDAKKFSTYLSLHLAAQQRNDERLISRSKHFHFQKVIKDISEQRMHNHLINNYVIGNKKALFNTMANYYTEAGLQVFDFLPLTFHVHLGMEDPKYFEFLKYYHRRAKEIARNNQDKALPKQYNAWIVKPGENSNRGNGIKVCLTLQQIKAVLKKRQVYNDGTYRTYIIQSYIQKPLLYCKRKFDLRHYIMITCMNGLVKGYWYKDGYVRTTSSQYSLKVGDGSIHLTNDAVQKNLPDYGKYQKGNKLSYDELNNYIEKHHKKLGKGFYSDIYPRMKRMATDAIRACSGGIDPDKLQNNFEVFGMDFMIDSNLNVWLIQINTNPCLELSCPLLSSLIPKMVQNALQITLDAIFQPPVRYSPKGVHYFKNLQRQNRFQLVYDQRLQRLWRGSLEVLDKKLLEEQDDTFEDCGQQWEDQT